MQVVLVVAGLRTNSQIQSPMMLGTSYQVVSSKNSIIISVVLCCVWFMTEHLESTATLLNRVKTGDAYLVTPEIWLPPMIWFTPH